LRLRIITQSEHAMAKDPSHIEAQVDLEVILAVKEYHDGKECCSDLQAIRGIAEYAVAREKAPYVAWADLHIIEDVRESAVTRRKMAQHDLRLIRNVARYAMARGEATSVAQRDHDVIREVAKYAVAQKKLASHFHL
jgi:hypothetical protein